MAITKKDLVDVSEQSNTYNGKAKKAAAGGAAVAGTKASTGRGALFNICCFLLVLLLLAGAIVGVIMGVGHLKSKSNSKNKSGAHSLNPVSGGKEGAVKSFNWCGENKRMAVLTFDDGPDVAGTPNVLADLRATGLTATFFTSPATDGAPDSNQCALIETILSEGHSVQSHSWNHVDFANLTDVEVSANLAKHREWVTKCAGAQKDKLHLNMFRPPFGSLDYTRAQFISNELGYTVATWNLESEDFRGGTARIVFNRIKEKYMQLIPDNQGSAVILMHDKHYVTGGSKGTIPLLAEYFRSLDYEFTSAEKCYTGCDPKSPDSCKMSGVWPGVYSEP